MRIAACIILYHPLEEDLRKDILAIAGHIDVLILWKNSPEGITIPDSLPCKVIWMGGGVNQFIAYPLNRIFDYCSSQGYDYLLTMDQDSEFEDFGAFLTQIKRQLQENPSDKTIIYAPNINHRYPDNSQTVLHVESTITSGSLHDVRKTIVVGGFRESYQINWVDDEFCYRSHLAGFDILAFPDNNLKQKFGHKKIIKGIECYNYSAQTYYHIFRNMLWMRREYKSTPNIKCILYTSQMYMKGILVGETGKWDKMKAIARGVFHGLTKEYR